MSERPESGAVVVLVVGCDPPLAEALAHDIRTATGGLVGAVIAADAAAAIEVAERVCADGGIVPVAFVESDVEGGGRAASGAVALHHDPVLATTRLVLVTSRATLHGVDEALRIGAVHGMITRPWTLDGLRPLLKAQLATHLVEHATDRLAEFDELLDEEDRRQARVRAELQRTRAGAGPGATHPLLDDSISPHELEVRFVTLLDRALGHPPRIRVAPGTIMIEEGDDVGGIYVLLDGVVRLTSRTSTGERILHERSTGPILGVLSLASHRRAMLRCQAVTDVRAIPITIDQLARAFAAEPELSGLLLQVLITALAGRLRRSDELQVELDQSLAALSEARAQLVATARFTAVGEMAAGMAHELNNPAAALRRGLDHLLDDVRAVIDDRSLATVVEHQIAAPAVSTSDQRARRRELTAATGDRQLADRLIRIGITEPDDARHLAELGPDELARLEAAARLGQTIRNMTAAADGIVSLVGSLRSYLRGDDARGPLVPDVDLAAVLDDALRLVSHRLEQVTVERRYGSAPTITARPGALQQVWTNLITNALDAMDDDGNLTLVVEAARAADAVVVQVIDDGCGIAAELQERVFEPRFTTKDGRVQFGMGLGLSISRGIVEEHGGSIGVQSRPGHTVFTVELPVEGTP